MAVRKSEDAKKAQQEQRDRERKAQRMEKLVPQYQPKLYTDNTEAKRELEQKMDERNYKKQQDPKWNLGTTLNREGLLDPNLHGNEIEKNISGTPDHKRSLSSSARKNLINKSIRNYEKTEQPKKLAAKY